MATAKPKFTTTEGVALRDLRAGMDVQVPEGQRRWYRILRIAAGDNHRRLAYAEVLGGKHAGTGAQITLFDYEAGYKIREPEAPAERLGEFVDNAVIETWALRTRDAVEVRCDNTEPHEPHEGAVTLSTNDKNRGYVPARCPGVEVPTTTVECPMDDPDCEADAQLDPESYVCHDACEPPALTEPVMVVPSAEFTACVAELGARAKEAGAVTGYDHVQCPYDAHTRDAGDHTRQLGDDDSDGQLVDQRGDMLCNECAAPLAYCTTHDVYVHLDPDTPPCFLVREALPQMECEGCGGVQAVTRYWDGEQMRYADPECASLMYFTELAVVKLGDTVNENYSASGEDLSTTPAEITVVGETLAEFGGPVSEEFDVAEWDRLLGEVGFRRVGFWNFTEYTAPVARDV